MDKENKKINKNKVNIDEEIANEISILEKHEVGEDSTKYGEFVSSYFAWISLPEQAATNAQYRKVKLIE